MMYSDIVYQQYSLTLEGCKEEIFLCYMPKV